MKRALILKFESRFGTTEAFEHYIRISIALTIALALKDVVMYYADFYLDLTIGMSLYHVEESFITSIQKLEAIYNLNLTILKFYYPLLGIVSMVATQIYYLANVKKFRFYGPTLARQILAFVSSFFPYTFITM